MPTKAKSDGKRCDLYQIQEVVDVGVGCGPGGDEADDGVGFALGSP